MPRRRLPARLKIRRARPDKGQRACWVIVDGEKEIGTSAGVDERAKAEDALQRYLAEHHRPPSGANRPSELLCNEVVSIYLNEHARTKPPKTAYWLRSIARPIVTWWGDRFLSEIRGETCRQYVDWRAKSVSKATARGELSLLRASINYYHREHGPLTAVPALTLPPRKAPRADYFLTRVEIAQRIRAARRRPETHHVTRLLLLGLYSGSRPGAMMRLRWLPSTDAGWIDVDGGVIHRRPSGSAETTKKQTPVRIHVRLLRHLRHWRKMDLEFHGIVNVVHFNGRPITYVYRAWDNVRRRAGHERRDTPHVLRHSAASLFMAAGEPVGLISGYLGMSVETLTSVYGHHHPTFQASIAEASPGKSPRKQVNPKRT